MRALPPPPRELIEEQDVGRMPPGAPLVLILIPSLIFWVAVATFLWHR